jgi:hypothetical protein
MVPSPRASRTASSRVSSKRPANEPSEKRVANLVTTVGGTRSNARSLIGGGGVCAEQSSEGIANKSRSKKSDFRPSTLYWLTLEIERICNSFSRLTRMVEPNKIVTKEEYFRFCSKGCHVVCKKQRKALALCPHIDDTPMRETIESGTKRSQCSLTAAPSLIKLSARFAVSRRRQ